MSTTARESMTEGAVCVEENQSLHKAAQLIRDNHVGALPICGDDNRLQGVITDRDIVVRCIAESGDPSETRSSSLGRGKPITIGADDHTRRGLGERPAGQRSGVMASATSSSRDS